MNVLKIATATVKEKVQNAVAKADEQAELNLLWEQAKAEKKAAETKAEEEEVIAKYHAKQAEIFREYEEKKALNKAEKEHKKALLHHKIDKHPHETESDHTPSTPSTPSGTAAPAGPFEEVLDDLHRTSEEREDMNEITSDPAAVPRSQVPMYGSGVPTHSELHSDRGDEHDTRTTQTMEATPNSGT